MQQYRLLCRCLSLIVYDYTHFPPKGRETVPQVWGEKKKEEKEQRALMLPP